MRSRWLPVGLLAVGIFAVNAAARFITWKANVIEESEQMRIAIAGVSVVALLLVAATVWWAVRYPFPRLFGEVGGAVLVGALLSVIVGPYAGGEKPFTTGVAGFVGQLLLFLGIAAVGVTLGYLGCVTLGRDWKSRGQLRYEERFGGRTRKVARG